MINTQIIEVSDFLPRNDGFTNRFGKSKRQLQLTFL